MGQILRLFYKKLEYSIITDELKKMKEGTDIKTEEEKEVIEKYNEHIKTLET